MKAMPKLTRAAQRRAEERGILSRLQDITVPPEVARGDVVELETPTGVERFVVRSRSFRFAMDGSLSVSFGLDHPVR